MVEKAKGIVTKVKIDRQLAEQSASTTPFMSINYSFSNSKRVTFNMQGSLEEKIDRLTTMMSKLAVKDEGLNKQFKPKLYQGRGRGQPKKFCNRCNYDQRNYGNEYRPNKRGRGIQFNGRIQHRQRRDRPRYK